MLQSVRHRKVWQLAAPSLVILAALVFVLAVSEPVRAKTMQLIRVVAGFTVEERDESPLKELAPVEITPAAAAPGSSASPAETTRPASPIVEPTVYSVPALALPEALANPPFPFDLPAWIPDGYRLDETAGVSSSENWVSLVWSHPDLSEIQMLVERDYTGYSIPAGENAAEEITINGVPALLVRGFWDAQHQWDPKRGVSLDWEKDGRHYRLNYSEREAVHHEIKPIDGDMEAIIRELVKMAESVR